MRILNRVDLPAPLPPMIPADREKWLALDNLGNRFSTKHDLWCQTLSAWPWGKVYYLEPGRSWRPNISSISFPDHPPVPVEAQGWLPSLSYQTFSFFLFFQLACWSFAVVRRDRVWILPTMLPGGTEKLKSCISCCSPKALLTFFTSMTLLPNLHASWASRIASRLKSGMFEHCRTHCS